MIGCGSVAERKSGPAFYKAPGSALIAVMGRRLEAVTDLGVPHIALAEYKAPANYKVGACPMCQGGVPITRF